jgi:methionyl-tRNA formyltransferase
MSSAVVFAYHHIGVRCLSVLLAHDVDVKLVVTHEDSPTENIWFGSVAKLAHIHRIPVLTPDDPNTAELLSLLRDAQPDFIFSFYYRHMLKPSILHSATHGAYNMHGSLLPKYRGRVPVNWAIIHGERETGATLHRMTPKPDAGEIVTQAAVPILPDDTAKDVFDKVAVAAEIALDRVLPALLAGNAPHMVQDLTQGSYFGGRRAEDGRIDWQSSAQQIHNLVRAVAPPYPGAFFTLQDKKVRLLKTLIEPARQAAFAEAQLVIEDGELRVRCCDGGVLRLIELEVDGTTADLDAFVRLFGNTSLRLT